MRHALTACDSAKAGLDALRRWLRSRLLANPSMPFSRNRCTHLYTKRRLIPTVAAMSVIGMPSARSKIIRARRTRPAAIVVARCHARSVRRWPGVRRIVREVLRPRAISRPSRQENMGPMVTYQKVYMLSQTLQDTITVSQKRNMSR